MLAASPRSRAPPPGAPGGSCERCECDWDCGLGWERVGRPHHALAALALRARRTASRDPTVTQPSSVQPSTDVYLFFRTSPLDPATPSCALALAIANFQLPGEVVLQSIYTALNMPGKTAQDRRRRPHVDVRNAPRRPWPCLALGPWHGHGPVWSVSASVCTGSELSRQPEPRPRPPLALHVFDSRAT